MATKARWIKKNKYGDYKLTPDRIRAKVFKTYQQKIINEVRKAGLYGKHAGSKPLHKLVFALHRYKEQCKNYKR